MQSDPAFKRDLRDQMIQEAFFLKDIKISDAEARQYFDAHPTNPEWSLKERVRASVATVFLVSPSTVRSGAAQWMELAYSDAYEVPTFVILHRLTFADLRSRHKGIPPLLLEGQCNMSTEWKRVIDALRTRIADLNAQKPSE